jgi:hypothetical protein
LFGGDPAFGFLILDSMIPPTTSAQSRSRKWQAVVLLIGVFVFGTIGGAGGACLYFKSQIRKIFSGSPPSQAPVDRLTAKWESELQSELDLTPTERESVRRSLGESTLRIRDFRNSTIGEFHLLLRKTVGDLCAVLPPDKAEKARRSFADRFALLGMNVKEQHADEDAKVWPK